MRETLAIRDARLYLGGQAMSMFGDSALLLALGIWAKDLTGSSAAAGLVILTVVVSGLLAPLTGLLVDRVRRRPLLIATNLVAAVAVLPLLTVSGPEDVWLLYVVGAVYGLSYTIIGAGQSALLVAVVPSSLLPSANGALQTVREGLRLVAPLAGAALFAAFGGGVVALVDAATFVAAAAGLAAMRLREPAPPPEPGSRLTALAAGARHVLGTPSLRRMTTACGVGLVALGFSETVYYEIVGRGLDRPAAFLGIVLAVQGLGAIAGGVTAATVIARSGEAVVVAAGMASFGAGCLLATAASLVPVLAGTLLIGVSIPWIVVGQLTLLQRRTPVALQGRAWSASELLCGIPQALAIAGGAALVSLVDYRILLVVMAATVAVAAAYLLASRGEARRQEVRAGGATPVA
ncbi:MAG TPA: MFS transporter [Capillimicrobium sp.]|nr:MFS transporter [Capillimicrobium sp.]